jgi:hypothetical protein
LPRHVELPKVLNDYHGLRMKQELHNLPDDMTHDLGSEIELRCLQAGIKPDDIAILYESIYRQRPKVHNAQFSEQTGATDKLE